MKSTIIRRNRSVHTKLVGLDTIQITVIDHITGQETIILVSLDGKAEISEQEELDDGASEVDSDEDSVQEEVVNND